jgi:hypothetical protein
MSHLSEDGGKSARHAEQYKPDFQQALLLPRNKGMVYHDFLSS